MPVSGWRASGRAAALVAACLATAAFGARAGADTWTPPQPTYQLNDASGGTVLSVLPPGEHGLYNAADFTAYEANGTRPAGSSDQLPQYADLLYHAAGLTDAQLPIYFNDESFGIPAGHITRTETPSSTVPVVIYRDVHEVPHIYAQDRSSLSFGAGYAAAEDRLFMMDVLRHYGAGNLSAFLGPSCADEQMDHDALLLGGYTQAQKQAQIDALPTQYGALGADLKNMATAYVAGINAYIAATQSNPQLLPADYAAAVGPPQSWSVTDVIDIATLVGGIFGKGGGIEARNAGLVRYLQAQFPAATAAAVFHDFKLQNDSTAPTTVTGTSFPYETAGAVDPSKVALLDNANLTGGPTDQTQNCALTPPSLPGLSVLAALLQLPSHMSNALLVDGAHSASGRPIAVMGPQVGYYTPQILMAEDMHAPDFDAAGVSFPGTNFIVELGRGRTFAWSATSANTDNVDQVAEQLCKSGGQPGAEEKSYLYKGVCTPMDHQTFSETAYPKPGGQGAPVVITHDVYYTVHGVVQGWTTVDGAPVAVVNQRSTYHHEVDSGVGFLELNRPSSTYDAASFQHSAGDIQYTFNWFYVDAKDIAYYQSGLDPIRAAGTDPNLPTWGTGANDWTGFLSFAGHPHEIGSPTGYITSWNNKPAPGFGAADDNYTYGPVQRVQSLNAAIAAELAAHPAGITRADLVRAMESAATVDLTGTQVLPELLEAVPAASLPANLQAMETVLQTWLSHGALRHKANPGDQQYQDAAAVAIMDELYAHVVRALFDGVFAAGGVQTQLGESSAYSVLPEPFSQNPSQTGGNGSAYYGGLQSQVLTVLRQLDGKAVGAPMSAPTLALLCGGAGLAGCPAVLRNAFAATFTALSSDNGGSTTPATWTANGETASSGKTLPQLDAISFKAVGVAGQPSMDWQNRPTYQQVIEFSGEPAAVVAEAPSPLLLALLPAGLAAATAAGVRRRSGGRHGRTRRGRTRPAP